MNVQEVGIRIVLLFTNGLVLKKGIRLDFELMNNEAEYKDIIYGLELAHHLNIRKIKDRGDSAVVVGQMIGVFEVKEPRLKRYLIKPRLWQNVLKR